MNDPTNFNPPPGSGSFDLRSMGRDRYYALMRDERLSLTDEEEKDGWFFCCEWDGMLINRNDEEANSCTCIKNENP